MTFRFFFSIIVSVSEIKEDKHIYFRQITMMQKIKSGMDRFRANHPKFPMFLRAVSQDALVEGTIIEINVTTPEGKNYCTNVKLKADDMELFDSFKNMQGNYPCIDLKESKSSMSSAFNLTLVQ